MSTYLPPFVIDVRVKEEGSRSFRIWLPVFLLWPLLLPLVALALIGTLIADLVLLLGGARYHHYTLLVLRSLGLLSAARGTHVRANNGGSRVNVDIY
ncbi:MAG: hypothetical protein Q7W51_02110 [Coriobacteriia bacterium]|nr:hypothetical protein [Coriobacteriia bacterium]